MPTAKSRTDSAKRVTLFLPLQPLPRSQCGIISKRGWEIAAKGRAIAGFEIEAAIAPPTNACAVAVM